MATGFSTSNGLAVESGTTNANTAVGQSAESKYNPRYIDIGINLADPIFRGRYHGSQKHPDDLNGVVQRAAEVGCSKLIVTGSSFKSTRDALKLAAQFPGTVFATAGIHPCSSSIFSSSHPRHHDHDESEDEQHTPPCEANHQQPPTPEEDGNKDAIDQSKSATIISDLRRLILTEEARPAIVAFGEFGLDYDRLHYCPRDVQLHSFAAQLELAASLTPQLPLFLHSRAAHADFVAALRGTFGERLERLERGGVVHSFTGTVGEMRELAALGLYIGVNGCSFKTEENCAVVREIELGRLMLETDGPWCEVRPTHAGWQYLIDPKPPAEADGVAAVNGEDATAAAAPDAAGQGQQPKKQQGKKKNRKKEPEVPDRFKVVKKEKWEEGAMVKGRNEPCTIERVAKIVARIKGVSIEDVCEAAWANTAKVFGLGDA